MEHLNYAVFIIVFVLFSMGSCTTDDPAVDIGDIDNTVTDNEINDQTLVNDNETTDADEIIDTETNDEANDAEADNEKITDDDDSSNLNTGDISGTQAEAGKPGAPCTKDEDCTNWTGTDEQYAICLLPAEGYPGGYCSFMCDSSVAMNYGCNGFGGVYYGYGTLGDGYCFHPCDDPADCRVGYRCSQTTGACMPDCAVDACSLGTCDETEKVCLDK